MKWLAWGMQQNQTVFFLENLQPVLLRTRRQYQQYWFVDRWLGVLVCVLVDGLVGGLVKGWIGALSFGLVFGLTLGLMVACFGGMPNRYPGASPRLWSQLYDVCIGAGVAILTLGVLGELIFGLSGGMAFGLVFGLIGGLLGSLAGHPSLRVRAVVSVETLRWSWRQVPASVGNGIVIGLVGGLIYALVVVFGYGFAGGLSYLAVYSLIVVVVFGLVGGFSGAALSSTTRPNQGIHRSLWRALSIGLGGGLIITQVYGLVVGPIGSLLGGLVGGLSLAFAYGGYAVLSHLALRFVLWRSGSIPWNYVRFLDNCADRIFLRKVGGGYIFIHRLLMEYFAELDTTAIEETQKEAT